MEENCIAILLRKCLVAKHFLFLLCLVAKNSEENGKYMQNAKKKQKILCKKPNNNAFQRVYTFLRKC